MTSSPDSFEIHVDPSCLSSNLEEPTPKSDEVEGEIMHEGLDKSADEILAEAKKREAEVRQKFGDEKTEALIRAAAQDVLAKIELERAGYDVESLLGARTDEDEESHVDNDQSEISQEEGTEISYTEGEGTEVSQNDHTEMSYSETESHDEGSEMTRDEGTEISYDEGTEVTYGEEIEVSYDGTEEGIEPSNGEETEVSYDGTEEGTETSNGDGTEIANDFENDADASESGSGHTIGDNDDIFSHSDDQSGSSRNSINSIASHHNESMDGKDTTPTVNEKSETVSEITEELKEHGHTSPVSIISAMPPDEDQMYTPTKQNLHTRPPFRTPSSVRAIQMSSPTPTPSIINGRSSPNAVRSKSRTSVQSSVSRAATPTSNTPNRRKRLTPIPVPVKDLYPLVLLHVTVLPLHFPYSSLLDSGEPLPESVQSIRDTWRLLQDKLGDVILNRGVLLPHPQGDFESVEEILLEALELPMRKRMLVLKCGHHLSFADSKSIIECPESDVDDNDFDTKSVDTFANVTTRPHDKIHVCPTCDKSTKVDKSKKNIFTERRFRVKVYASNGLMAAGAWVAAWKEMERVDVEIEPYVKEEIIAELDNLQMLYNKHLDEIERREEETRDREYAEQQRIYEQEYEQQQAYEREIVSKMENLVEERDAQGLNEEILQDIQQESPQDIPQETSEELIYPASESYQIEEDSMPTDKQLEEEILDQNHEPEEEILEPSCEPEEEVLNSAHELEEESLEPPCEPEEEVLDSTHEPEEEILELPCEPEEEVLDSTHELKQESLDPTHEPGEDSISTDKQLDEETPDQIQEPEEEVLDSTHEPEEEILDPTHEPEEETMDQTHEPEEDSILTSEQLDEEIPDQIQSEEEILDSTYEPEEEIPEKTHEPEEDSTLTDRQLDEETPGQVHEPEEEESSTGKQLGEETPDQIQEPEEEILDSTREPEEETLEQIYEPEEDSSLTDRQLDEEPPEQVHEPEEEEEISADNQLEEEIPDQIQEPVEEIHNPIPESEEETLDQSHEPEEEISDPVPEFEEDTLDQIHEPEQEILDPVYEPEQEPLDHVHEPEEETSDPVYEPEQEPEPEILDPVYEPEQEPAQESLDHVHEPEEETSDPVYEPEEGTLDQGHEPEEDSTSTDKQLEEETPNIIHETSHDANIDVHETPIENHEDHHLRESDSAQRLREIYGNGPEGLEKIQSARASAANSRPESRHTQGGQSSFDNFQSSPVPAFALESRLQELHPVSPSRSPERFRSRMHSNSPSRSSGYGRMARTEIPPFGSEHDYAYTKTRQYSGDFTQTDEYKEKQADFMKERLRKRTEKANLPPRFGEGVEVPQHAHVNPDFPEQEKKTERAVESDSFLELLTAAFRVAMRDRKNVIILLLGLLVLFFALKPADTRVLTQPLTHNGNMEDLHILATGTPQQYQTYKELDDWEYADKVDVQAVRSKTPPRRDDAPKPKSGALKPKAEKAGTKQRVPTAKSQPVRANPAPKRSTSKPKSQAVKSQSQVNSKPEIVAPTQNIEVEAEYDMNSMEVVEGEEVSEDEVVLASSLDTDEEMEDSEEDGIPTSSLEETSFDIQDETEHEMELEIETELDSKIPGYFSDGIDANVKVHAEV